MYANLTEQQKAMLKNAAMIGLLYLGTKLASKAVRYGLFGAVAYSIYNMNKKGSLSGGWQMKVDPGMAVDLLFPKMKDQTKVFARMAADSVLGAILSPSGIIQPGRI
jgi:hypothetical protein